MTDTNHSQKARQRRGLREKIEFLERWHKALTLLDLTHASRRTSENTTPTLPNVYRIPRNTAMHHLQKDYYALVAMQDLYASLRLNRISRIGIASEPLYEWPDNKQQNMLVRAFHGESHSKYEEQLGFTCSGLERCNPYHNLDDLLQSGIIQERTLRNHCGGALQSLLISASDDPVWLLELVRKFWPNRNSAAVSIAFIRTDILQHLQIPYVRSDHLVKRLGAERWHPYQCPEGVQYTHDAHWLIYGWVPPQAVCKIVSLHDFDQACSQAKKGMFPSCLV